MPPKTIGGARRSGGAGGLQNVITKVLILQLLLLAAFALTTTEAVPIKKRETTTESETEHNFASGNVTVSKLKTRHNESESESVKPSSTKLRSEAGTVRLVLNRVNEGDNFAKFTIASDATARLAVVDGQQRSEPRAQVTTIAAPGVGNGINDGLDSMPQTAMSTVEPSVVATHTTEETLPAIEEIALSLHEVSNGSNTVQAQLGGPNLIQTSTSSLETTTTESVTTSSVKHSVSTQWRALSTLATPKTTTHTTTALPATNSSRQQSHENAIDESNEIRGAMRGQSPVKRAKFINDNSTNAQQLNLPDAAEVWSLAGMKAVPKSQNTTARTDEPRKQLEEANEIWLVTEQPSALNASHVSSNSEKNLLDWTQIMMHGGLVGAKHHANLIDVVNSGSVNETTGIPFTEQRVQEHYENRTELLDATDGTPAVTQVTTRLPTKLNEITAEMSAKAKATAASETETVAALNRHLPSTTEATMHDSSDVDSNNNVSMGVAIEMSASTIANVNVTAPLPTESSTKTSDSAESIAASDKNTTTTAEFLSVADRRDKNAAMKSALTASEGKHRQGEMTTESVQITQAHRAALEVASTTLPTAVHDDDVALLLTTATTPFPRPHKTFSNNNNNDTAFVTMKANENYKLHEADLNNSSSAANANERNNEQKPNGNADADTKVEIHARNENNADEPMVQRTSSESTTVSLLTTSQVDTTSEVAVANTREGSEHVTKSTNVDSIESVVKYTADVETKQKPTSQKAEALEEEEELPIGLSKKTEVEIEAKTAAPTTTTTTTIPTAEATTTTTSTATEVSQIQLSNEVNLDTITKQAKSSSALTTTTISSSTKVDDETSFSTTTAAAAATAATTTTILATTAKTHTTTTAINSEIATTTTTTSTSSASDNSFIARTTPIATPESSTSSRSTAQVVGNTTETAVAVEGPSTTTPTAATTTTTVLVASTTNEAPVVSVDKVTVSGGSTKQTKQTEETDNSLETNTINDPLQKSIEITTVPTITTTATITTTKTKTADTYTISTAVPNVTITRSEYTPKDVDDSQTNSLAEAESDAGNDDEDLTLPKLATTTMGTLVANNSTKITSTITSTISTTEEPLISLLDDSSTTTTISTTDSAPSSVATKIEEIYKVVTSTTQSLSTTTTVAEIATATSSPIITTTTTTMVPKLVETSTLPFSSTTLSPTSILQAGIGIGAGGGNSGDPTNSVSPNFPGMSNDNLRPNSTDGGETDVNVIIAITVSVIGVVALILLVAFLYLMRKRQKQMSYGQRCRPVSLDAYSLDNVSVLGSVRRKGALRASKRSYGNAAFDDPSLRHNPLSATELGKFLERRSSIFEEFRDVPQIIARADEVPHGCEDKNRYANVIPLPETRVILQQQNGDDKTEYINANYVRGPKDAPNYYIACQAPLEATVADFWRMIWEQQSRVIIQTTDLVENGIEKCAEYLPPSVTLDNHNTYGDYQVTLKNREIKDKYAISTLMLKHIHEGTSRELTHYWYKWPEAGVPSEEAPIIAMLLEARSSLKSYAIEQANELKEKSSTLTLKSIEGIAGGAIEINGSNGTSNETSVPIAVENKESSSSVASSNGEINGNVSTEKLKATARNQGPLIVHCSPGTGRTGTIIACDMAVRSLETPKRSVDIPQIVYYVRRGRASAVQTKEQYEFIYKVANMYATKITNISSDN